MHITINDQETIGAVRKKFSTEFPFLRIDFFRPLATDLLCSALRIADEDAALGTFRKQHNSGDVEITAAMSTKEVEQKFLAEFGLHMQIFRRSGNKWLLTTATDGYTLEKQNTIGESMSHAVESEEPMDIHEQE